LDLGHRHCRSTALRRIDGAHKAREFPQRLLLLPRFGKVFYFRPGHETFPTYYNEDVLKVIANGARWAAAGDRPRPQYALTGSSAALEPLPVRG
jgi:trehalose utilization protein